MDEILRLDTLMFVHINELDACEYETAIFTDLLAQTQKVVDEFCMHDYSNFSTWIGIIDGKVERMLLSFDIRQFILI